MKGFNPELILSLTGERFQRERLWGFGSSLGSSRVWVSGVSSFWRKLASMGIWVEGCAENLGFDSVKNVLDEEVLQLPDFQRWTVLNSLGGRDWDGPKGPEK